MAKLSMGLNPISKYRGPNAAVPIEGTMAYDDSTKDIYSAHWNDVKNEWEWKSRTAEIQRFLDNLSSAGLFEASAAFVNNRKILRFYYDTDNGIVRLNSDLRFDASYRYYAIRSISKTANGGYEYITGETNHDGNIVSSLVNMDLVDSAVADGTQESKPGTGKLYGDVIDGNAYIVEFYDINRTLIDVESYQAVKVRTADTDLCPDTAIKDLLVHCNQESNGAFYLHQGQSVDELAIQVLLDYGDDLLKDVSHEETNGGRLAIQGLDEIDTSTLTADSGVQQKIVVAYTMIRSNASYPVQQSYNSETGAIISPNSNTIYKEIPINIVANDNTDLVEVIPVGYILPTIENVYDSTTGAIIGEKSVKKIKLKFFGHYSDGTLYDITRLTSINNDVEQFNDENIISPQNIVIQVRLGYSNYKYNTYQFTIYPFGIESNAVTFKNGVSSYVSFDTTQNAGGIYSGSFVGFTYNGQLLDPSELINQDAAKYGDIQANYIRIRDVKDPSFYYTDIVQPSDQIFYKTNSEHILTKDTPLLVEFYRVTVESSTNKTINIFATGAMLFFADTRITN